MIYERIEDCPPEVQNLSPKQGQLWLRTYNRVFRQTEDELAALLAAWGAVDKTKFRAVKAMGGGRMVLGWALMFTDEDHPDLHDTHFSHLTSLLLDYYGTAPLWYEHGYDPDYGYMPIGRREPASVRVYGHGVLMGHNLHLEHPLYQRTLSEVERGELSYSSDSIGHYVDQGYNFLIGELRAWPFAGCSLTGQPAEPGLGKVALKSFADHLQKRFDNRPVKVFSVLKLLRRKGAGGAKDGSGGTEHPDPNRSNRPLVKKGLNPMEPEMLAQLASFFKVEPVVEEVVQALEEAITLLEDVEGGGGDDEMMTRLRSALDLAEDAPDAELADTLRDILAVIDEDLEEEPEPALSEVARFAKSARRERQRLPVQHNPARWGMPAVLKRKVKAPGLLDLIGAASRRSRGDITFPMPAFDARTSPDRAMKAMGIVSGPNGGYVLNREMSDELLDHLYSRLIFTRLGVRRIPMAGTQSLTFNRLVSGAQAYWAGAGKEITDANPGVRGAVTLQLRELVSESIQENQLLRNSSLQLEQMIEDDMVKAIERKIEGAVLYGTGSVPADGTSTGAEPLGLRHLLPGDNIVSLGNKVVKVDDLVDIEGRVEDTDVEYGMATGWVSHNAFRRQLKKLKNSNGDPIYSQSWMELEVGGRTTRVQEMELNDHRLVTSTQIPNVASSPHVLTDVFFGEWDHALFGQGLDMEVVVDTSVLVRKRQTLIQIVTEFDFGVAYKEAFQILTDVKTN